MNISELRRLVNNLDNTHPGAEIDFVHPWPLAKGRKGRRLARILNYEVLMPDNGPSTRAATVRFVLEYARGPAVDRPEDAQT